MLGNKIIVAGNWKMNKTYLEAKEFVARLNQYPSFDTEVILAVPSLYADTLYINNQKPNVHIVLQNVSEHEAGAYTGEISARMIASLAMKYCLVGHSERRTMYHETDKTIAEKIAKLVSANVLPILCIGESLEQRNSEQTFQILTQQLKIGLSQLQQDSISKILIAYEPVWAIGTGVTATAQQAAEVHAFIYDYLCQHYGHEVADHLPVLYGGSCNEKNAKELFSQPHISGGLIGGASLSFETFVEIIKIAEELQYAS